MPDLAATRADEVVLVVACPRLELQPLRLDDFNNKNRLPASFVTGVKERTSVSAKLAIGAGGGTRTRTGLPPTAFEAVVPANSTTPASEVTQ